MKVSMLIWLLQGVTKWPPLKERVHKNVSMDWIGSFGSRKIALHSHEYLMSICLWVAWETKEPKTGFDLLFCVCVVKFLIHVNDWTVDNTVLQKWCNTNSSVITFLKRINWFWVQKGYTNDWKGKVTGKIKKEIEVKKHA